MINEKYLYLSKVNTLVQNEPVFRKREPCLGGSATPKHSRSRSSVKKNGVDETPECFTLPDTLVR